MDFCTALDGVRSGRINGVEGAAYRFLGGLATADSPLTGPRMPVARTQSVLCSGIGIAVDGTVTGDKILP
jgi:hypothetical protein